MKMAQNSAKVSRIVAVIVVVTILIQVVNFFDYFMNSSGDQSTVMNSLIMYLGMAVILACIVFAVVASRANKPYHNDLKSSGVENAQAPAGNNDFESHAPAVIGEPKETAVPSNDVTKNNGPPSS